MSPQAAKRDVVVTPFADDDISEAVKWYEDQQSGLANRFLQELQGTFERLRGNPFQFPIEEDEVRQAVLRSFPYTVYFRVNASQVVILAFLHQSRHPATWRTRA